MTVTIASSMRREATHDEIAEINRLIPMIEIDADGIRLPKDHAQRIHDLVRQIHGYRASSGCISCMMRLIDVLRRIVGLGSARRPGTEELTDRRLAVCVLCPAYHANTGSCGRLVIDALNPQPVEVDGRMVNPCGCIVSLKARFKSEHCPANRWPNR